MENKHEFLFKPYLWTGDGLIVLNMVEEELKFQTNWNILAKGFAGKLQAVQELQIAGISENMRNELTFYDFTSNSFTGFVF